MSTLPGSKLFCRAHAVDKGQEGTISLVNASEAQWEKSIQQDSNLKW